MSEGVGRRTGRTWVIVKVLVVLTAIDARRSAVPESQEETPWAPQSPELSPIVKDMRRKHGLESCACVGEWEEDHGFPKGGSMSLNQLETLKSSLEKKEKEMLKAKKVKSEDVERMKRHFKCLEVWQKEAEHRKGKAQQGKAEEKKDSKHTHTRDKHPPAHPDTPPSYNPLYPSLTSWDDPTLLEGLVRRPPQLQAPPPPPPPARGPSRSPSGEAVGNLLVDGVEHFSPIARRVGQRMPMVQAVGPDGVQMVYRPWSYEDMEKKTQPTCQNPKTEGLVLSVLLSLFAGNSHQPSLNCTAS